MTAATRGKLAARPNDATKSIALATNAGRTTRAGPRVASTRESIGTMATETTAAAMNIVGSAWIPNVERKSASRTALPATCSAIIRSAAPAAIQLARRESVTRPNGPTELDWPAFLRKEHVGDWP